MSEFIPHSDNCKAPRIGEDGAETKTELEMKKTFSRRFSKYHVRIFREIKEPEPANQDADDFGGFLELMSYAFFGKKVDQVREKWGKRKKQLVRFLENENSKGPLSFYGKRMLALATILKAARYGNHVAIVTIDRYGENTQQFSSHDMGLDISQFMRSDGNESAVVPSSNALTIFDSSTDC